MDLIILVVCIILVTIFAFTNGMKDGNNVVATAIASGSIPYKLAMFVAAISEFLGPFLLGTAVASTVAKQIINIEVLPHNSEALLLILSGVVGAIIWNFFTWIVRMPTSSSFALIGGMIGPVLFEFGEMAVPWRMFFIKVIGALFLSPVLGIFFGHFIFKIINRALETASFHTIYYIKKIQILCLIVLGSNHGTNDSQKSMGIIALLLFVAGKTSAIEIPFWVKLLCASSLTIGLLLGGTKIIKTVGYGIFKLRPLHSLTSQISAATILLCSNMFGAPVSTTQIISSSVIGVGSAYRKTAVKWLIIKNILWSWILTIPLSAILSMGIYYVLKILFLRTN